MIKRLGIRTNIYLNIKIKNYEKAINYADDLIGSRFTGICLRDATATRHYQKTEKALEAGRKKGHY
jgi:hypothetical protein